MAFCAQCGAQIAQGMSFCGQCGKSVASASPAAPAATPTTPSATPAGGAPAAAGAPITSNVAALLTYLPFAGWIIGIVFLVIEPYSKDKFVRFHSFQSIFLGVACFVLGLVYSIMTRILWTIPLIGWFVDSLLGLVLWLGVLVLWIFLMFKAYNNEKFKLPVIGDMAEKQAG